MPKPATLDRRSVEDLAPHAARAAEFLRSVGNEQRLMILCHLLDGPLTVGEINASVSLSQSALSQHLAVLRDTGVVTATREGLNVRYALASRMVKKLIGMLRAEFCS